MRLALILAFLAALAAPAAAANLWFDFNHDANFATIQPRSAQSQDTLSVVLDLTGVSPTAPFTVIWNGYQTQICMPQQTEGGVANLDSLPGSRAAGVDSAWIDLVSGPGENNAFRMGFRFTQVPATSPLVAIKYVLTYPSGEIQPCPTAGVISFNPATLSGVGVINGDKQVRIHDTNVPVQVQSWGRLRQAYR